MTSNLLAGFRHKVLDKVVHVVNESDEDYDALELTEATRSVRFDHIKECRRGELVDIRGRLRSVSYVPLNQAPMMEAELFDGTGSIQLVWLGRRRIYGIQAGQNLLVRGRLSVRAGGLALYNPWYALEVASSD